MDAQHDRHREQGPQHELEQGTFPYSVPRELLQAQLRIEEFARENGLEFFPIHYEMVSPREMNAVAAFGGFPRRYPHWRFGMSDKIMEAQDERGQGRIFELVINNNPVYAYLQEGNPDYLQKLVMCHVCAHADFFKNNQWFAETDRNMIDRMGDHANRVERYMRRYGQEEVEKFLDACISLDNLIDFAGGPEAFQSAAHDDTFDGDPSVSGSGAKSYIEEFLKAIERDEKKEADKPEKKKPAPILEKPWKDVLRFLMSNAELEPWQLDILRIVRAESYYFAPQGQTKIMNEGWASFWHQRLMDELILPEEPAAIIPIAKLNAGVLHRGQGLNPYALGVDLFKDIKERWDRGTFGPEYDACNDREQKENWDQQLGLGMEKIFQVRRSYNDVTFINEFLTFEFAERTGHLGFDDPRLADFSLEEKKEIFEARKAQLIIQLSNGGNPLIRLEDANFRNRMELLLRHDDTGMPLDYQDARDTLENLFQLWKRPVHIETVRYEESLPDARVRYSFDGKKHTVIELGAIKGQQER